MDPQTPKSHRRRGSSLSSSQPTQSNTPTRRTTVKRWQQENPISGSSQRPSQDINLPFSFGVEFELQLRAKNVNDLGNYPDSNAPVTIMRRYNFNLLQMIAEVLTDGGMNAVRHDLSSDDQMDYTKWNIVLDGSLSKAHMKDGYCKLYSKNFILNIFILSNMKYRSGRNCHASYSWRQ